MKFLSPAICTLIICLANPFAGHGQIRDFRYTLTEKPWLSSANAAVLESLGQEKISRIDVSYLNENGAVIPIEGSNNAWKISAGTESYMRFSDKLVFSGEMSYDYNLGHDMGGQVLMFPDNNSIGIIEEDLSTRGDKKRETYRVATGMSYAVGKRWSVGLRFDYTAADQTKYKDPRTHNTWMDITLSPGVLFGLNADSSFGMNLIYRHTIEEISAGLYGTLDRTYYYLIDLGAFYGMKEVFVGDVGYISDSNARPMYNDYYGAAFQFVSKGKVKSFVELRALWRDGYYGTRTSSTVVFCEYNGPEAGLNGTWIIPAGNDRHIVALSANYEWLSNYLNTYTYDVQVGLSTKVVYHGQTKTLSRHNIGLSTAYSFQRGIDDFLPKWDFGITADFGGRIQTFTVYPNRRDYFRLNYNAILNASRNIKVAESFYSINLSCLYGGGMGEPAKDSIASGSSTSLRSFDDYSNRQFEYETAARAGAGLELTYTRIVSDKFAPYVKLSDRFQSLLSEPQYLDGRTRNVAMLTLGCSF